MQWLSQYGIWILLAAFVLMSLRRGGMGCGMGGHRHGHHGQAGGDSSVKDPVTGNPVDTRTALTSMHQGSRYWFESETSRARFEQNPGQFVGTHTHRHGGCC
ncbi:YHS domain-containing protein [Paludibacterium purpuratum]|uniref:YHS domain-containing protein n=1 Tax=Paludibacterium purpuratum TaxID=1144873 RepID=A0A4R7B282_9NEIS|nr:YHS domain-containing protein [Paludibacterium purpuratum]TDR77839.1 YHS domain-containing protein [Paludibacterium purpuratum]